MLIKVGAIGARPVRAVSNWRISLIANDDYGDIVNALITERQIRPVVYRKLRRMCDRAVQRRKRRTDSVTI